MKILQWLGLSEVQTKEDEDRIRRYEYGLREVERWTEARQAIIEDGEDTNRRFAAGIDELIQREGPRGAGVKVMRHNLTLFQARTEEDIQQADYRLAIYRNIVLMQGRI